MIKITKLEDVYKISNKSIIPYVKKLINNILDSYSLNCSLETVGGIYYLETIDDLDDFMDNGLPYPLSLDDFDTVEFIENNYIDGCIVINNDFAINIIGKREYFENGVN